MLVMGVSYNYVQQNEVTWAVEHLRDREPSHGHIDLIFSDCFYSVNLRLRLSPADILQPLRDANEASSWERACKGSSKHDSLWFYSGQRWGHVQGKTAVECWWQPNRRCLAFQHIRHFSLHFLFSNHTHTSVQSFIDPPPQTVPE